MKVQEQTQTYTESQVISPDGFGGWMCVNVGSAQATVMGYPLAPGEGLNFLYVGEHQWLSRITMDIPVGAAVRMTRLKFTADSRRSL